MTSTIITSIGRVSPDKRPLDAVKIVRIVRETIDDAELVWIGGGPQLQIFQRLRSQEPYVRFLGDIANKWEWLRKGRVHISTSIREGFNLPVGEALLARVPVVVYDLPVYRHVYKSGVIYVPRFKIEAFAKTVIDVLQHPDRYMQVLEQGRKLVTEQYSGPAVARRIEESLARMIN